MRCVFVSTDESLAFVLSPARDEVDLVRRDDERGLVSLQDVEALDRLRPEPLIDIDDQDRQVRQCTASGPQRRKRDVARRVDEKETGNPERAALYEIAAHLEDCRERDFGGPDVLRDSAGLAARDAGAANSIEEGPVHRAAVPTDG